MFVKSSFSVCAFRINGTFPESRSPMIQAIPPTVFSVSMNTRERGARCSTTSFGNVQSSPYVKTLPCASMAAGFSTGYHRAKYLSVNREGQSLDQEVALFDCVHFPGLTAMYIFRGFRLENCTKRPFYAIFGKYLSENCTALKLYLIFRNMIKAML